MPRMSVKLAPWFLSFRKSKQFYPYITFPTHCSWMSVRRKLLFHNFWTSNSHSFGGGRPKSPNIHVYYSFWAPATKPVSSLLRKSSMFIIQEEWRRGFSSLRANIPLIGMLKYLHQFFKTFFGTPFPISFSYNHPNCRRKLGGGFMCIPFPFLRGGNKACRGGVSSPASLCRTFYLWSQWQKASL